MAHVVRDDAGVEGNCEDADLRGAAQTSQHPVEMDVDEGRAIATSCPEQRLVDSSVLAELDEVKKENVELRQKVAELQEIVDSHVAVLPEGHWLGQGALKGP